MTTRNLKKNVFTERKSTLGTIANNGLQSLTKNDITRKLSALRRNNLDGVSLIKFDNFADDKIDSKLSGPFVASKFKPGCNKFDSPHKLVRQKSDPDYVPIKIDEYGLKGRSPLR